MMYLTTKQLADLVRVNQETIRRWYRKGKLDGTMNSTKGGIRFELGAIARFINDNPKYATIDVVSRFIAYATCDILNEWKTNPNANIEAEEKIKDIIKTYLI